MPLQLLSVDENFKRRLSHVFHFILNSIAKSVCAIEFWRSIWSETIKNAASFEVALVHSAVAAFSVCNRYGRLLLPIFA